MSQQKFEAIVKLRHILTDGSIIVNLVYRVYQKHKIEGVIEMAGGLLDKAIESAGGLEEFQKKMAQFRGDLAFIDDKREELLQRYDENWVAVYKHEVVAHGEQYDDVIAQIRKRGLPTDEVVIKFLSSRKVITLFQMRWGR